MDALTLFVIRHAEKPGESWPGPGYTAEGASDTESLVLRGWQRAGAWTALFGTDLTKGDYAKPDAIYAATPGADPNQGPSSRPAETISALATRLALTPNEGFGKGDEKHLMDAVLASKGVALLCWEHKAIISDILPRIPISKGKPPTKWDGSRFDVVLRFDRAKGDDDAVDEVADEVVLDDELVVVQGRLGGRRERVRLEVVALGLEAGDDDPVDGHEDDQEPEPSRGPAQPVGAPGPGAQRRRHLRRLPSGWRSSCRRRSGAGAGPGPGRGAPG